MISTAVYRLEGAVPSDYLCLIERIWFGDQSPGPFTRAREAYAEIEADLEHWERRLEIERRDLVKAVLGVETGDDLVTEERGRLVRFKLESLSVLVLDDSVLFQFHGRRYRKDGVLGKMTQFVSLRVEAGQRGL